MSSVTDTKTMTHAPTEGCPSDDAKGRERNACAMFFVYMRLNSDGSFTADRYCFEGTHTPIDASPDPAVAHSLGYYAQDMAKNARSEKPDDRRYQYHGSGLEGFVFPQRYSYCVFFMDCANWKFETDNQGRPVINFHARKKGKTFDKHDHAFRILPLLSIDMPGSDMRCTEERQAAVMINRMRNKNNDELKDKEKESYSFDLWMRVGYANGTDHLTLIIDPGGTNLGPPRDP